MQSALTLINRLALAQLTLSITMVAHDDVKVFTYVFVFVLLSISLRTFFLEEKKEQKNDMNGS